MSAVCNRQLIAEGKPHPQACRRCGPGRCSDRVDAASQYSPDLKEIAARLKRLSYRDMTQLADMVHTFFGEGEPGRLTGAMLLAADDISSNAS